MRGKTDSGARHSSILSDEPVEVVVGVSMTRVGRVRAAAVRARRRGSSGSSDVAGPAAATHCVRNRLFSRQAGGMGSSAGTGLSLNDTEWPA